MKNYFIKMVKKITPTLYVLWYIFFILSCNSKGQRTRSFKLTKDSTFIGAWGGTLTRSYGAYIPTSYDAFHIVFIYTKNNKIYVNYEPLVFDTDSTKEKENLEYSLTDMHTQSIQNAFDDSYSLESETVINKPQYKFGGGREYISSMYQYEINNDGNLIFSETFSISDEYKDDKENTKIYYFTFKPYYFKTIPNPEDKK